MSEVHRVLPEGTILNGVYELRACLGAAGDDLLLYAAVDGTSARPRTLVLLSQPLDSPPDLRSPASDAPATAAFVPPLLAAFESDDRSYLALGCALGEPLSGYLPIGCDEDALDVLLAVGQGLQEFAEAGADTAPLALERLYLRANGLLSYVGPFHAGAEDDDPLAALNALAAKLAPSDRPWSVELEQLLVDLAQLRSAEQLAAALARIGADVGSRTVKTVLGLSTDSGVVRDHNEDAVATIRERLRFGGIESDTDIIAVADGVGGHRDGERAAALAINSFVSGLAMATAMGVLSGNDQAWQDDNHEALRRVAQAFGVADETVSAMAERRESSPPGTTLVAALRLGRRLLLGSVGDSRGYLLRDGALFRLTRDDSVVQELVDRGALTAAEAFGHPSSNQLTRFVGAAAGPPEMSIRLLRHGDRVLLCSDGVTDSLRDEALAEVLNSADDAAAAAELVVLAARAASGTDNLTAATMDIVLG